MAATREESTIVERETLYMAWREDRDQAMPRPLQRWIADYPGFADDFIAWASDLPLIQPGGYGAGDLVEEARLAKVGRSVVAEMRARYGLEPPPLISLTEAARQRNLRFKDVAVRVGIGVPILSKLEQRLLRFATLPESLIVKLAAALELGTETVRDYLRLPPTLAAGAAYQYTGKSAPQVSVQEDFAQAVRSCPGMTESDKQVWLTAMEPPHTA